MILLKICQLKSLKVGKYEKIYNGLCLAKLLKIMNVKLFEEYDVTTNNCKQRQYDESVKIFEEKRITLLNQKSSIKKLHEC